MGACARLHVQDNMTAGMTLRAVNMDITNAGETTTPCKTQFAQVKPLSQMGVH